MTILSPEPAATQPPACEGSVIVLLLLLLVALLLPGLVQASEPTAPAMSGGIHINEPDLDAWSQALLGAGMNSVQVTAYARQAAWNSADFGFGNQETSDIVVQLQAARRAGLKTILVLRTYLEHALPENRHLWHGRIAPADDQLDAWFEGYRAYALWGARLAAEHDVDLFVVGNELNSMTSTVFPDVQIDPHEYFLDETRVAAVREDLVACAESVRTAGVAEDLGHLDGWAFEGLEEQLRDAERARRAWAEIVTGGGTPEERRAHLEARGRRLDQGWRGVISAVREVYDGPVTYGANFDQFHRVGFWDALDAVGVTSYFPLRQLGEEGEARAASMRASWHDVAAGLTAAATLEGRDAPLPVYMLELGWTRRAGTTVRPWSYGGVDVLETAGEVVEGAAPPLTCVHWAAQPEDTSERVDALSALADVVASGGFPALRGFSLWKLTTRDYHHAGEPFAILVPAEVPDNTPVAEDTAMLGQAARLGRLLAGPGAAEE